MLLSLMKMSSRAELQFILETGNVGLKVANFKCRHVFEYMDQVSS